MAFSALDYGISDDTKTAAAARLIRSRLSLGSSEQARLVDYCARNIPRDRYVHPHLTNFKVGMGDSPISNSSSLFIRYARGPKAKPWSSDETIKIHKHAMGQLCDVVGLDRRYMHRLDENSEDAWRRNLLAVNLNTHFMKQQLINRLKKPAEFLHRLVGDELRAVLTQSYNRHLVSAVVLQPFLAACSEVGLQPAKAVVSDMRVHLQTYLPYAFQPIPGEFVALGTCWGNSDFGQGKLRISHNVMRLNGGGNLVTDDAFSRVHIGGVVTDTDMVLSDEVAKKELEAVAEATRSAVLTAMQPEQVNRVLEAIQKADAAQIPWAKLKGSLSKALTKVDLASIEDMLVNRITDLPTPGTDSDGEPLTSKWWAAAAVSHLAENTLDTTKQMELKTYAGQLLM